MKNSSIHNITFLKTDETICRYPSLQTVVLQVNKSIAHLSPMCQGQILFKKSGDTDV